MSRMMKEILGDKVEVLTPLDIYEGWDILTEEGYQYAESLVKEADHTHMAFPCRSFTPARRSDEFGSVPVVRSLKKPEGWGHYIAEEGNRHLQAVVRLCLVARSLGHTFSLENPWKSFAWLCRIMEKLLKLPGVMEIYLDQCCYGATSKKPTCIATDAVWMAEVALHCKQVRPHKHFVLSGKMWDEITQSWVWKTRKAAEYPSGLCLAWSRSLLEFLQSEKGKELEENKTMVKVGKFQNALVNSGLLKRQAKSISDSKDVAGVSCHPEGSYRSNKEKREAENLSVVGGLRDPRRAVARNPHLRSTGGRLRKALEIGLTSEVVARFEQCPEGCPFDAELVAITQRAIAEEFQAQLIGNGYEKKLIFALLHAAHDPDRDILPKWLDEGFPLGVEQTIPWSAVFPKTDEVSAAIKISATIGKHVEDWDGSATNYSSFYEAGDKAQNELDRLVELGRADKFGSWEEVVGALGEGCKLTPLACIVKESHGKEKVRLIVDMRRSGINGCMQLYERIVLPRVSDVAKSVQEMAEVTPSSHDVEFCVADFSDAFYTMTLHPDERKNVIVKDGLGSFYGIKVASFGLASAPLLWGRLASAAMRLSQAAAYHSEARAQCYVDDPILAVMAPTQQERTKAFLRFLLCWTALGFAVAWKKVARGAKLDWIGVQLAMHKDENDWKQLLVVSLSEAKTTKLHEVLSSLMEKSVFPISQLQYAVGVLGWLSSIIPIARPWLSMLWAALSQALTRVPVKVSTRVRKGLVFRKQIQHATHCLLALLKARQQGCQLVKKYVIRGPSLPWVVIESDACPTGIGAAMYWGGQVRWFFSYNFTDGDLAVIGGGAERSPAYQSEFELLAILMCIKVFPPFLKEKCQLFFRADNVAALQAALEFKAHSPIMALLAGEVALELEHLDLPELQGRHLAGLLNDTADKLSRGQIPLTCASASRVDVVAIDGDFFRAWPQAQWSETG